jgi:hypothetical protein
VTEGKKLKGNWNDWQLWGAEPMKTVKPKNEKKNSAFLH